MLPTPLAFPTPTASNELTPSSVHLLVKKLFAAGRGTVHVLQAPPGAGKSTLIQQELAGRWRTTPGLRILWATHGTHEANSLGGEAEKQFRDEHGVAVRRLFGRKYTEEHGWAEGAYEAQFEWSPDPLTRRCEIKIISHAHLRSVFAKNAAERQRALRIADLLVIDEDPTASLLLSYPPDDLKQDNPKPLNLTELSSKGNRGVLGEALLAVMNRALTSDLGSLSVLATDNPITGREWRSLTGTAFQTAWKEAVGSGVPDWAEFRKLMPVGNERWVTDVLQHEYTSGQGTQRFGITWDAREPRTMTFRYDVRQPLQLTMPTLILDAYADEELYRALFAEQQVEVATLGTPQPLDIEVAPQASRASAIISV